MKSKHSPGPWAYQAMAGDHDFAVYSESESSGRDIALVRDFDEANAKLIAAAPQLLAALIDLVENPYDTEGRNIAAVHEICEARRAVGVDLHGRTKAA